jgi:hypothetical protein
MTMPELSGIPGTLPPLLPCPMCGSDKDEMIMPPLSEAHNA